MRSHADCRRVPSLLLVLVALCSGLWAASASAATIEMTPASVSINAVIGRDFTLTLDSGDSTTNILDFTIQGGGGCGTLCASTAVAAIVFDGGTTVLSATDTVSGLLSSSNVVRGLVTPDGTVIGLLIDTSAPSAESFSLQLSSTPTTATLYSLDLSSLAGIDTTSEILATVVDSTRLRFDVVGGGSTAVPEPTAAAAFAVGLLAAGAGIRRRA